MNIVKRTILILTSLLVCSFVSFAQNTVKATLLDASTQDAVGFATVSLTVKGEQKPVKYALSSENGVVSFSGVKKGTYVLKAELLGYKPLVKEMEINGALDLGKLKMESDLEQIDAAKVSAVGNPIVVKKDTIEYNASSFKTTDNDVLEDLLKKLPGVEVSEDGSITVNGETISKITIDGKTFFLDDPQMASKNIPAKMVEKLKVINKKSEQAEFTGIDDGEEEKVIDLSVKPGMMKGMFGNLSGGFGHDTPTEVSNGDYRYQGNGFVGRFTDKTQLSVVLNGNNTNNRGFNDMAGSMMGGMMGGGGMMGRGQGGWGGQNGITTSYMGGVNLAGDFFDDAMELGGNYLYNQTDKDVLEDSKKYTYLDDYTLKYLSHGTSGTSTFGHRFGVRLDHKFSENTSILFEPQINFGGGSYTQTSRDSTFRDDSESCINKAFTNNTGNNNNLSTSGFLLFRQRLGIPGRTLTAMARYSYSNNVMTGINNNGTTTFTDGTDEFVQETVNQNFDNQQNSYSLMGRVTYTEPLGNNLYFEANYAYNWNKSVSDKQTYDMATGQLVEAYSNNIVNESRKQDFGVNMMYQNSDIRGQVGFSAKPTQTLNTTDSQSYSDFRWNFSPQAMFWGDFNDNANGRLFYRGDSGQPSTSQLMPVPDNTDPLNIRFGNPTLTPYFSHSFRGDVRYNNKKTFSSFNINFDGSFVQNPIVNAIWYNKQSGAQYTMPFNGPTSGNLGFNMFLNLPIAKSGFSISNMTRASWSRSASYVGSDVDMTNLPDPTVDYYGFMDKFLQTHSDLDNDSEFVQNVTESVGFTERLRFTYRVDNLELTASGRTRFNTSWYTISTLADNTTTWNNQINATANWTWSMIGLTAKGEFNYNWYKGYSTAQPSEYVLNATVEKTLFKNKATIALKGYDILGQAKNLTVSDQANYHTESVNNTLGRYIILSFTYRFGTFDRGRMGGGPMGGHGGPPPMR